MARAREITEAKPPPGFIASAVKLPAPTRREAGRAEGWQGEAWAYWETVGELRYVATWKGNVMSRARLVAGKRRGNVIEPITRGPAAEAVEAFYGGPQGQSEFLQAQGVHLTMAGEDYVINRAAGDRWDIVSSGKVTTLPGGKLQADFGTGGKPVPLQSNDLVIRIWTPHPRDPTRADSPVHSNLGTLAQIVSLDRHITAQLRSRLAGAGILFLSNEVQFPTPPGADPAATQADNFMALLGESMLTPIQEPGNAAAVVPIVAMVPTDSLGKNDHVKFWTELDANAVSMREAAIKRLALGLDVPPEVLLGVADANHWNAWLSEESAVKAQIEPGLEVIVSALTATYLRPAIANEVPDPEDFFVLADTSAIRLRPNRSEQAIELYDRGELSGAALRRETGFDPGDAPAAKELEVWLLRKLATAASSPELVDAAIKALGVDIDVAEPSPTMQLPPDHMRIDTDPTLPPSDSRVPPQLERGRARGNTEPGLVAACNVLVFRALERAGNRLRNMHPRTDTTAMTATDVYRSLGGDPDKLVAGAWECAAEVLGDYTDDVAGVVDTLDFYVRGLLTSHRPHSMVVLGALLDSRPLAIGA